MEDFILYESKDRKLTEKIACFDLDHTIIQPKSKKLYPIDENDWQFKDNVIDTLKFLHENDWSIIIFTNQKQGGKQILNIKQLTDKFRNIEETLKFPITVMAALQNDHYRKPFTGMWETIITHDYTEGFYCGDAYMNKRFDDIYFAKNVNIAFMTPESVFVPKINHFEVVDYLDIDYSVPIDFISNTQYAKETKQIMEYTKNLDFIFIISSPASGKTHFCKTHLSAYVRMSKDDYRTKATYLKEIRRLCAEKQKIVFDNTNHTEKSRMEILNILPDCASIGYIFRDIDKKMCLYLNKYRYFETKYSHILLPEIAIHTYYKNVQLPKAYLKVSHCIEKLDRMFYC